MAEISIKSSLAASSEETLASIGGFGDLENLLPGVTDLEVHENREGKTIRSFRINGTRAEEQLKEQTSRGYFYSVVKGPPVHSLTGGLWVDAAGSDRSIVEWSAVFEPDTTADTTAILGIFAKGLANVSRRFNGNP